MNARLRARLALWLLAPALLFVAVMGAFPVLSQFVLSFSEFNLKFPDERGFAGLGNYEKLLSDGVFWVDLGQTAFFTVASVGLELLFGLAAALLVNRIIRGRTAMNSSLIVPWALPTVVAATMWSLLLNDRVGLVNSILDRLGLMKEPIVWLGPKLAMVSLIAADVWKTTPFVAVAVLFRTMDAFRIFDLVWVLTGGASRTETLSVYIQKVLFRYADLGYGSTMTVALFFIVFALSLALIRFMRVSEEVR